MQLYQDNTVFIQDRRHFTWLQCFGTYVYQHLGTPLPECIPELKAYQATITRASREYVRLVWFQCDSDFRQVALNGLKRWSAINPTIDIQQEVSSYICVGC